MIRAVALGILLLPLTVSSSVVVVPPGSPGPPGRALCATSSDCGADEKCDCTGRCGKSVRWWGAFNIDDSGDVFINCQKMGASSSWQETKTFDYSGPCTDIFVRVKNKRGPAGVILGFNDSETGKTFGTGQGPVLQKQDPASGYRSDASYDFSDWSKPTTDFRSKQFLSYHLNEFGALPVKNMQAATNGFYGYRIQGPCTAESSTKSGTGEECSYDAAVARCANGPSPQCSAGEMEWLRYTVCAANGRPNTPGCNKLNRISTLAAAHIVARDMDYSCFAVCAMHLACQMPNAQDPLWAAKCNLASDKIPACQLTETPAPQRLGACKRDEHCGTGEKCGCNGKCGKVVRWSGRALIDDSGDVTINCQKVASTGSYTEGANFDYHGPCGDVFVRASNRGGPVGVTVGIKDEGSGKTFGTGVVPVVGKQNPSGGYLTASTYDYGGWTPVETVFHAFENLHPMTWLAREYGAFPAHFNPAAVGDNFVFRLEIPCEQESSKPGLGSRCDNASAVGRCAQGVGHQCSIGEMEWLRYSVCSPRGAPSTPGCDRLLSIRSGVAGEIVGRDMLHSCYAVCAMHLACKQPAAQDPFWVPKCSMAEDLVPDCRFQ